MSFSYHPKYESIADEVREYLSSYDLDVNFIVGGDGSFLVYSDFDMPNYLIYSDRISKGFYGASCYEKSWKKDLEKFSENPENFVHEIDSIEVLINDDLLPDNALNEIVLGKDYCFKAIVDGERVFDSGLVIYACDGWNGWARKYGAEQYDSLGVVGFDDDRNCFKKLFSKKSKLLIGELFVNVLEHHYFNIMFDGKGENLDNNYIL